MCGRFSLTYDLDYLGQRFQFEIPNFEWQPRYNLAPTQNALVIVENEGIREAHKMKWGLIPHWAKDAKIGYQLINARADTLSSKPSFKESYKKRRCLILADGFYEWKNEDDKKKPIRATLKDKTPFAFAGLWDAWKNCDGEVIESCTIITTQANELMMPIHDRMPAILSPNNEQNWIKSYYYDERILSEILRSYPSKEMICYPVSNLVSSWKNDSPKCILPI